MPEPDLQAAIKRIETSRQTHVEWRDYWLGIPGHAECVDCKKTADIAGDLDRQVRVIAEYDNVLAVLRDTAAAATRARAEALREAADQLDRDGMKRLGAHTVKQWLRARADSLDTPARTKPTTATLLADLAATREADQGAREKRALGGGK